MRQQLQGMLSDLKQSKAAFQAMPPMPMPGSMDPAMGGGMPPDPAMMQGGGMPPGMPPDPAMMQGGGAPPDPSMQGGAPPAGGPDPEQVMQLLEMAVTGLEEMAPRVDALEQQIQQIMQGLSEGNDPQPGA